MTVFTEFTGKVITEEQLEALAAVFFEQMKKDLNREESEKPKDDHAA